MPPRRPAAAGAPRPAVAALKRLVRGELGCSCPERVFERVDVLDPRAFFAGLPGDCLLAIGDRLLLLVIGSCAWPQVLQRLEPLLRYGRELRDVHGYNRFRLVVACERLADARSALLERWRTLPDKDDRVHLHVVSPAALVGLDCMQRGG